MNIIYLEIFLFSEYLELNNCHYGNDHFLLLDLDDNDEHLVDMNKICYYYVIKFVVDCAVIYAKLNCGIHIRYK